METILEVLVQLIPSLALVVFMVIGIDLYLKVRLYIQLKTKYYQDKMSRTNQDK